MLTRNAARLQVAPPGLTHAQFINCKLVPRAGGGTDKIPLDRFGREHDAHDPAIWQTAEEAIGRPWQGVSFVLTRAVRVICLDFDRAWDAATQAWSPLVQSVLAWFPEAYVEVSQSGTGLHVMFTADLGELEHRCKSSFGFEMYSEWRHIMLTGVGARGRVDADYTTVMPAFIQSFGLVREPLPALPEGGRAENWSGPEDDDELIALIATNNSRTAGHMFDGAATLADVWAMRVDALARTWPDHARSDLLPYDWSSVDMALASHLSYFTGRDLPRMERIVRRWVGYRPSKWERSRGYYLHRTLRRGTTNTNVHGSRQVALVGKPAGAEGVLGEQVLGQYLACMPNHNIYDRENRRFIPTKSIDDRIGTVLLPGVTDAGGVPKRVSASKYLFKFARIDDVTWFPGQPEIIEGFALRDSAILESPGNRLLNTYKAPTPMSGNPNDVGMWLEHIYKLYPDYGDLILRWMCFVAQNPGKKINHALVLGGPMRVGKDACILEPLVKTLGDWNCERTSPKNILKSEWNDYLRCVLLMIDEARDTGGESRFDFFEQMKTIIAAPPSTHRINPKKQEQMIIPNVNNTVIGTNHLQGGLYLPPDDGRHLVTWTNARRGQNGLDDAYFERLWNWFNNGGLANCSAYLLVADVHDFKQFAMPVKTSAFWEMVEGGQTAEHHEISDLVDAMNGEPFSLDQLAAAALMNMNDKLMSDWMKDKRNGTKIYRSLAELGCIVYENPDEKRKRWLVNGKQVKKYRKL